MNRGFTIIEMVICLAIFVLMTTLVVTKFGTYNRRALVRDSAYDIALTMRQAQTYGLSVRNSSQAGEAAFDLPYGLAFAGSSSFACGLSTPVNNSGFSMFLDYSPVGAPNGICTAEDVDIRFFRYTHVTQTDSPIMPSGICVGTSHTDCTEAANLYVSFKRPHPDAIICYQTAGTATCDFPYAEIRLTGNDGSTSAVAVRSTGQISVLR